jgi:hypothetical protein
VAGDCALPRHPLGSGGGDVVVVVVVVVQCVGDVCRYVGDFRWAYYYYLLFLNS